MVVGWDEQDNKFIGRLMQDGDYRIEMAETTVPLTLVRGPSDAEQRRFAGCITARYSRRRDQHAAWVRCFQGEGDENRRFQVSPDDESQLGPIRIGR
ncbi:MAG: hypothetical protein ACOC0A_04890 [Planctomycetota bacterium]